LRRLVDLAGLTLCDRREERLRALHVVALHWPTETFGGGPPGLGGRERGQGKEFAREFGVPLLRVPPLGGRLLAQRATDGTLLALEERAEHLDVLGLEGCWGS